MVAVVGLILVRRSYARCCVCYGRPVFFFTESPGRQLALQIVRIEAGRRPQYLPIRRIEGVDVLHGVTLTLPLSASLGLDRQGWRRRGGHGIQPGRVDDPYSVCLGFVGCLPGVVEITGIRDESIR